MSAVMRGRGAVVAALAVALAVLACGNNGAQHAAQEPAPADTLRGTVAVTGAEPATRLVLHTADGRAVRLEGQGSDALRRMRGLEVWVAGRHVPGDALDVRTFRVRGLDGMPAVDGTLEVDGGAVVLVTGAGERVRFPRAPTSLRELAGRHVWIAGRPGATPEQWGLIPTRP